MERIKKDRDMKEQIQGSYVSGPAIIIIIPVRNGAIPAAMTCVSTAALWELTVPWI